MASIDPNSSDPNSQVPPTDELNSTPETFHTPESLPNCTAIPSTAPSQPWQAIISFELRTQIVRRFVQALFPSPDPEALQNQPMANLVNYACRMEKDMFEQASSRVEYYHLLAEKVYEIQRSNQEE
ncbi:histone acetyltransferase p300-like [Diadema setosum]|uniref:histone acetyltransferase p300-like n=1 Tax=Diadema setosum TaxID=31175 RepID=UPI003B3A28A5